VRAAQRESTEPVTIVVLEKFFTDTLQHEPAAEPEPYQQVTVSVKELHATAWIRTGVAQSRKPFPVPQPLPTFTRQSSTAHDLALMLISERFLHDETNRIRLLGLLPGSMTFGVSHDLDSWSFAQELATACLRHGHGAFHLAEALKVLEIDLKQIGNQNGTAPLEIPGRFDSDSGLMPHLRHSPNDPPQAEPLPADVFPPARRTELLTMLANVVIPDIEDLYRGSGGRDAPDLGKHTTHVRILDALSELNARADGIPRTLVFVEHLAARVGSDLKIRLRKWANARAAEMDLGEELNAVREEALQSLAPTPPVELAEQVAHLVIQLERIVPSGNEFLVKSWRQFGDSPEWWPVRQADLSGSLEEGAVE
jgi:NTP-dependent ternary conflict system VMAP-like protein